MARSLLTEWTVQDMEVRHEFSSRALPLLSPSSHSFRSVPDLAIITALHVLAVLSTIFRLARRIQIRRLSWDDAWAVLAALLGIGFIVTTWMISWKLGEF